MKRSNHSIQVPASGLVVLNSRVGRARPHSQMLSLGGTHGYAPGLQDVFRKRLSALPQEGGEEGAHEAGSRRSHLLADGLQPSGTREADQGEEGLRDVL